MANDKAHVRVRLHPQPAPAPQSAFDSGNTCMEAGTKVIAEMARLRQRLPELPVHCHAKQPAN